ncbi:hypothetical protein ACSMDF_03770 [Yersinia enterocolitica]
MNNVTPIGARISGKGGWGGSDSGQNDDGGGGDMHIRVAKLESDVEHIKKSIDDIKSDVREIKRDIRSEFNEVKRDSKTDFRLLFGAIIAVALGLSGLMAKGFHWL